MSVRDTSLKAYREIEEDGTLGRLQWAVYQYLFHSGPLTTRQVHAGIDTIARDVGIVSARLAEMQRLDIVRSVGQVECELTGKLVHLWDVTSKIPVKEPKRTRHKCPSCHGKGWVHGEEIPDQPGKKAFSTDLQGQGSLF